MDQYFTSVRELEQRLHSAEAWEYKPKPVVKAKPPEDIDDAREFVQRTAHARRRQAGAGDRFLAPRSRSSSTPRSFTTSPTTATGPKSSPSCAATRNGQFDALDGFLTQLDRDQGRGPDAARPDDGALRHLHGQRQLALATSTCPCCWPAAASSMASTSPSTTDNNYPLTNLYVSMLQRLGIETDEFSTGKGPPWRWLELAPNRTASSWSAWRHCAAACASELISWRSRHAGPPAFFDKHCIECHDADTHKGEPRSHGA